MFLYIFLEQVNTMQVKKEDLFTLLRKKEIIFILNGDTKFDEYIFDDGNTITISMPYLSGPKLCDLSTKFGLPKKYNWEGGSNLSRWEYMDNLLKYCINENKISALLSDLFSIDSFSTVLSGRNVDEIKNAYATMVQTIIGKINGELYFGGNELVMTDTEFYIRKIGSTYYVETPKIKVIDRKYISSISERAMQDVEHHNFDSALTKARTLLEEVFRYVLEKKNVSPSDDGDIAKLYKQVTESYNMHIEKNMDKRIKKLLSGLNSIVSGIAEMRNKGSDSHGLGESRINIEEHHAVLVVNSARTLADFILSVEQKVSK